MLNESDFSAFQNNFCYTKHKARINWSGPCHQTRGKLAPTSTKEGFMACSGALLVVLVACKGRYHPLVWWVQQSLLWIPQLAWCPQSVPQTVLACSLQLCPRQCSYPMAATCSCLHANAGVVNGQSVKQARDRHTRTIDCGGEDSFGTHGRIRREFREMVAQRGNKAETRGKKRGDAERRHETRRWH